MFLSFIFIASAHNVHTIWILFIVSYICGLQWLVMFLIEFFGITKWDVKVVLYLLVCIIMIYIACGRDHQLASFFVACPALALTLLPQVLTSTGRKYWKSTMSDFVYFIYVCFGYWDSNGICRTLFQVEEKVKIFNDTHLAGRGHIYRKSSKETEDVIEKKDDYYYFNYVISATIGTRVLLIMIFKIFTPLALYVRYTCPYPIFVYDQTLLDR